MSIQVSLASRAGKGKTLWAWSASIKHRKFGSTKTTNKAVGELVAAHSVLTLIPSETNIVFRTFDKSIHKIFSSKPKQSNNPLLNQVYALVHRRKGFVRCILVSPTSATDEDKRAVKILEELSGASKNKLSEAVKPKKKTESNVLSPKKTTKVTATRKRRKQQPLTTGLEDWDDGVDFDKLLEKRHKPVLCDSCNAPISPLTNECLCSM